MHDTLMPAGYCKASSIKAVLVHVTGIRKQCNVTGLYYLLSQAYLIAVLLIYVGTIFKQ
jgi:hypothetical protein